MAEDWVSVGRAAAMAGVDPATIRRWADTGRVFSRRTPAGHRRVEAGSLRSSMGRAHRPVNLPADVYELCARLRAITDTLLDLDLDALAEDELGVLSDRLTGRYGVAAELGRFTERLNSAASPAPVAPPSRPEPRPAPSLPPRSTSPNPLFDRLDRHLAKRDEPSVPLTAEDARRLLFPAKPPRPLTPEDFDYDEDEDED